MHAELTITDSGRTVRQQIPTHVWERFERETDGSIADALRLYCELENPGEMLEGVA